MAAASGRRGVGVEVIAGAPNIVRGGSHSGNVSAADLIRAGTVDALASDYVPAALVEAAWELARPSRHHAARGRRHGDRPPARMARLADRGRLEAGLRADLVRVRPSDGLPVVRQVWRAGERVLGPP